VVLGVMTSLLAAADSGQGVSYLGTLLVFFKAAAFLAGAVGLGMVIVPRLFRAASWLRGQGVLLSTAIVLCLALASGASAMGLALAVHGERILDPVTYSAIILMVMITTFVTPPALKWSFEASGSLVPIGDPPPP